MTTSSQHHPFKQWFGCVRWLLTQASTPFSKKKICITPQVYVFIRREHCGVTALHQQTCKRRELGAWYPAFRLLRKIYSQVVKTNLFSCTKCRLYQTENFRSAIVWVPAAKLIAPCQVGGTAFARSLQIYQSRLVMLNFWRFGHWWFHSVRHAILDIGPFTLFCFSERFCSKQWIEWPNKLFGAW